MLILGVWLLSSPWLLNQNAPVQDPAFYMLKEDETPCIFGSIDKQRWSYACAKQLIERLIYGTIPAHMLWSNNFVILFYYHIIEKKVIWNGGLFVRIIPVDRVESN